MIMNEMRKDGRTADQLRRVKITRNIVKHAIGSALVEMGDTKVICCVSMEEKVPQFLRNSGTGWLTAEYGMLPASTPERTQRMPYPAGRNQEIQRLIGRALRSVINLKHFGERTLWVDCDVLQADGGTRTAAINGAFCALVDALVFMKQRNILMLPVLRDCLAAVSVGIVGNHQYLDLCYAEDSIAQVDFNVVMTGKGEFVEIQGSAEGTFFSRKSLDSILALAEKGITEIISLEKTILKDELQILAGY
jgi:ribonuclease PH